MHQADVVDSAREPIDVAEIFPVAFADDYSIDRPRELCDRLPVIISHNDSMLFPSRAGHHRESKRRLADEPGRRFTFSAGAFETVGNSL
jgi:hypothetical protein